MAAHWARPGLCTGQFQMPACHLPAGCRTHCPWSESKRQPSRLSWRPLVNDTRSECPGGPAELGAPSLKARLGGVAAAEADLGPGLPRGCGLAHSSQAGCRAPAQRGPGRSLAPPPFPGKGSAPVTVPRQAGGPSPHTAFCLWMPSWGRGRRGPDSLALKDTGVEVVGSLWPIMKPAKRERKEKKSPMALSAA